MPFVVQIWQDSQMPEQTTSRLVLARRPRRLRRTDAIRRLVRETHLTPDCFIYPLFICEGKGVRRAIASMPGVFQLSVDEAVEEATAAHADGVPGVLLFGLPERKDAIGSSAADPQAPVDISGCSDAERAAFALIENRDPDCFEALYAAAGLAPSIPAVA